MESIKKITALLFSFVCIALALWVVAHNLAPVALSLGFFTFTQPQWVWLVLFAFIGFIVTALVYQARIVRLKLQVRALRKQFLLQERKAESQKISLDEGTPRLG